MSQDDPSDPVPARPEHVYDAEPPVTLSEALGEQTRPALSDLPGIGEVFEARLHRRGVSDPEEVPAMGADELAEALDTSPGRAANIVEAAQSTLSRSSSSRPS